MASKIEITEQIIETLKQGAISYSVLYNQITVKFNLKNSEFATCVKDLKNEKFVDYEGNFNDDQEIVLTRLGEQKMQEYESYAKYLGSLEDTKYDKFMRWAKNNVIIVSLIILVTVIGAIIPLLPDGGNKDGKDSTDSIPGTNSNPVHNPVVNPPKITENLCDNLKVICEGPANEFNGIKDRKIGESSWATELWLENADSCYIDKAGLDLGYVAKYYEGNDKAKAIELCSNLKNRLSLCLGKSCVLRKRETGDVYTFPDENGFSVVQLLMHIYPEQPTYRVRILITGQPFIPKL